MCSSWRSAGLLGGGAVARAVRSFNTAALLPSAWLHGWKTSSWSHAGHTAPIPLTTTTACLCDLAGTTFSVPSITVPSPFAPLQRTTSSWPPSWTASTRRACCVARRSTSRTSETAFQRARGCVGLLNAVRRLGAPLPSGWRQQRQPSRAKPASGRGGPPPALLPCVQWRRQAPVQNRAAARRRNASDK